MKVTIFIEDGRILSYKGVKCFRWSVDFLEVYIDFSKNPIKFNIWKDVSSFVVDYE